MIRFLYQMFCRHEWRALHMPRFYDHKYAGVLDCLHCNKRQRILRPKPRAVLIDLVAAIDDIERGHTLEKAGRLASALDDAHAILYDEIRAAIPAPA